MEISVIIVCILGCFIRHGNALLPFKLEDCSPGGNSNILRLTSAEVEPEPIMLPGAFNVSVNAELLRDLGTNMQMEVSIRKKFLGFYIPLPCMGYVGTCTYHDLCDVLEWNNPSRRCWRQLAANNMPCFCPFSRGNYTLQKADWNVSGLWSIFTWLAVGDYKGRFEVRDRSNDELVMCYDIQMSARSPNCQGGLLCELFG